MAKFQVSLAVSALMLGLGFALPAAAEPFSFSTGAPDGRIGTLSRLPSAGAIQTETADDFILSSATRITQASFYGLIPSGTPLSSISQVEIEFYHVFPVNSGPFDGKVPTRTNSPADVEIDSATRDSADGSLSFHATLVNPNFAVANTVINGINPIPNQTTGGEGPTSGEEVLITVDFTSPIDLPADHYFFRPEALLSSGNFLFLSESGPPLFTDDLQSWIRNDNLAPDWLRIGTDIVGGNPEPKFNAAFSLEGTLIPEPASLTLLGAALAGFGVMRRRRRTT